MCAFFIRFFQKKMMLNKSFGVNYFRFNVFSNKIAKNRVWLFRFRPKFVLDCSKTHYLLERKCWGNEQYSRRECLEISRIPCDTEANELLNMFEKLDLVFTLKMQKTVASLKLQIVLRKGPSGYQKEKITTKHVKLKKLSNCWIWNRSW